MLIDGEDMDFLWNTIQDQQVIFHPNIAPDGEFDYQKFFASKAKKPFILFIDRNILSSLLKFCERGSLKNKGESQLVGVIMAWTEMNNIAISAGLAVRERASQLHSQEEGLIELQKFLEIFDYLSRADVAGGCRGTADRNTAHNVRPKTCIEYCC